MTDQSPSRPDSANDATGVDKAMKQFSQTDAERERAPTVAKDNDRDGADDTPPDTQPPRSDAPADATANPPR
jgi:hypothetical protein